MGGGGNARVLHEPRRGHLLIRSASPPDLDQPSPHNYLLPALAHEEGSPSGTLRLSFETTERGIFPVLGYVSLVDNPTGDPVFYPADPVEN